MPKAKAKEEVKKDNKPVVTQAQLDAAPAAIQATFDGQSLAGEKKTFSTGSTGWNVTGKVVIGGLRCQVTANVTVIGSKK